MILICTFTAFKCKRRRLNYVTFSMRYHLLNGKKKSKWHILARGHVFRSNARFVYSVQWFQPTAKILTGRRKNAILINMNKFFFFFLRLGIYLEFVSSTLRRQFQDADGNIVWITTVIHMYYVYLRLSSEI